MRNIFILAVLFVCPACRTVETPTFLEIDQIALPADQDVRTKVLSDLMLDCPLDAPARVEFLEIDAQVWGRTWWDQEAQMYRIQVDTRQPLHAMLDTLIHEWAHAMVWNASKRAEDAAHGPIWGVAWARCYRVLLKVRLGG